MPTTIEASVPCRRLVSFGHAAVAIDYTPGKAASIVDFLYGRMPAQGGDLTPVSISVTEEPTGQLAVSCGQDVLCRDESAGAIASWLLHMTTRLLAAATSGGLLLHAGAVTWNNRGLVLPGPTGTGKTTLVTYLVDREFGYLTDELAFVPSGTMHIDGFRRPLKIKNAAVEALETECHGTVSDGLVGWHEVLAPANHQPAPPTDTVPLHAIVYPRFRAGAPHRLHRLSGAVSALRMMESSLNSRLLPDHGFREVTRLAREIPSYEMSYGSLEQLNGHLDSLKSLVGTEPSEATL